jgi:predicted amidohydrolase
VEFPELSRLMADEGMNILFVPSWQTPKTDIQE